jgi:hypothetical protein
MSVILVFIGFVIVGDGIAILISSMFEGISAFTSLIVFLSLYVLVFYVAWQLAVLVTERYLQRPN